ncbi:Crp/Fnr family transcriptional regulator [Mucilaginibacter gynuensis]|uniref:Crp/Fnr family transcriptional regulator n=1 Tax=Mucilaginibacter gynuensis TaxID=1302236 RepID=A0ABP8H8N0_9SPHI
MFAVFKKYIDDKINLTAEDWALIESLVVIKKLRKHQYLLQEGDLWKYHAFVCEGCLRTYRIDDKGQENIMYFAIENWWTGDRESLHSGNPSRSNIDAVEDTVVLLFTYNNFEAIKNTIPVFRELINTIIDRSLVATQNRVHTSISQTAEERYNSFLANSPHLANRVPQHMIASYLGISPETLSRVRKQAVKK